MSEPETSKPTPDADLIQSVWAEARDLIKRLEGSTVQRLAVAAGEYRIEIERGLPVAPPSGTPGEVQAQPGLAGVPMATGAGPGPGVAPEARTSSGMLAALTDEPDGRVPVLAPLVGTFYRASQPGAKPFIDEGDVVDAGQTVCIVEAMKLMNEVAASAKGRVAEVVAENGQWVEFEQVLMYLDPVDE